MDVVLKYRTLRWLAIELAKHGQSIRKTGPGEPEYARLGRYSRWKFDKPSRKILLLERDVDLEDLAGRVRAHIDRG